MISAPVRCRAARFAARPCSGSYPPAPGRLRAMGPPPKPSAAGSVGKGAAAEGMSFAAYGEANDLELAATLSCSRAPPRFLLSRCAPSATDNCSPLRRKCRRPSHHSAENAAGLRPACFSVCVVRCCPAPGRLRASYCTLFPGKKKEGQSPLFFSPIYFASAGASTLPNSWPL